MVFSAGEELSVEFWMNELAGLQKIYYEMPTNQLNFKREWMICCPSIRMMGDKNIDSKNIIAGIVHLIKNDDYDRLFNLTRAIITDSHSTKPHNEIIRIQRKFGDGFTWFGAEYSQIAEKSPAIAIKYKDLFPADEARVDRINLTSSREINLRRSQLLTGGYTFAEFISKLAEIRFDYEKLQLLSPDEIKILRATLYITNVDQGEPGEEISKIVLGERKDRIIAAFYQIFEARPQFEFERELIRQRFAKLSLLGLSANFEGKA